MFNKPFVSIAGIFLALALGACRGPLPGSARPRPAPPPEPAPIVAPPAGEVPLPSTAPVEVPAIEAARGRFSAILAPAARADALAAARFLADRPRLKTTIVFPDGFFDDKDVRSKQARALFQTLISSGQVDVPMSLPLRPMMALLMDTDQARLSSAPIANLPPRFSWPSDVTEQVDLARASHRRRWRQSPRGVILPWDAALGPEIALLAGGKLEWALRPSSGPVPSLTDDFKIPLLRPALFPRGIAARAAWFKDVVEPALIASGAFGPVEVSAPEDLAALETLAGGPDRVEWILVGDQAAEDFASLARVPAATPDFTPWIGEADENRAWELLGLARASVSEFQNSGRADLRTLEMAQREIFTAESGRYFFLLGSETEAGRDTELKREFMATLNQVYQIMGVTMPPEVQRGFDSGGAAAGGDDQDGAFSRDGASFRWGDAANDDRGPGDYFYPTGSHYVSGAWDLRAFSVRPAEDWLVLTFDFTALPNPWGAPGGFSFPLVDVYMDINRSVGAGSQELLPGRPGQAAATDAWEYALSVDGWGGRLFQYAPGRPPRAAGTFPVARVGEAGFAVSLPRGALRGDPGSMGFAVVVMGRSPASAVPMPAAVNPGPTQFGGAAAGRAAPPFIDLLAPRGLSQRHVLGAYKAGQEITIPFLHAE